ncbi:type III secretion protein [Pseudomonas sp. HN11]|nr:type III secretion protein [Pseudomonas sp. HN11]UII74362.1 type III secretion protein [Pseudomonas sp. HN11]
MMARNNDDAVQLLKGIGELYRRNGQSQRALVMLLIAVSVAPHDGVLLRSLVLAFTDSGDAARALSALDRLVTLEGESASLLLLRARALWYGERKDEARQCFKRYLAARRAGA